MDLILVILGALLALLGGFAGNRYRVQFEERRKLRFAITLLKMELPHVHDEALTISRINGAVPLARTQGLRDRLATLSDA